LACDLNKHYGFGMSHLACNLEAFWQLVTYGHNVLQHFGLWPRHFGLLLTIMIFFNTLTYGMGILAHGLKIEAYGLRNYNLVLNNWFVV
jgi:hypothetical protein